MYLENINETHVFSSFGTTFINSQAVNDVKTITFTEGYNLDSNLSFKVLFENGHNCTNASTPMTLNGKNIKVYIRGTLSNLPIHTMTINNSTVYVSLQSGTILELYYNGSNFVVVGNPIIYSSDDYEIYANGDFIYKKKSYTNRITESGNNNVLLGNTSYSDNCYGDINVSNKCGLTFNPSTGVLTTTTFCGALSGTATTSTNADKGKNGNSYSSFGSNAFNSTAFTTCTGTVTQVNIGTTAYNPTSGVICLPAYPTCVACASCNGDGVAFGSSATCDATAFRASTWWPDSLSYGCVSYANTSGGATTFGALFGSDNLGSHSCNCLYICYCYCCMASQCNFGRLFLINCGSEYTSNYYVHIPLYCMGTTLDYALSLIGFRAGSILYTQAGCRLLTDSRGCCLIGGQLLPSSNAKYYLDGRTADFVGLA